MKKTLENLDFNVEPINPAEEEYYGKARILESDGNVVQIVSGIERFMSHTQEREKAAAENYDIDDFLLDPSLAE